LAARSGRRGDIVRIATVEDIPAIVEMGRAFHAMSPHKFMGEYMPDAVKAMLAFLIASPDGLVITSDTGAIGGVITRVYFNPLKRMMEEAFWWAGKDGKAMRELFEAESKKMGADFCFMSNLENERTPASDRLYRMAGYTPVERRYVKVL
jgi:hypothetical protein